MILVPLTVSLHTPPPTPPRGQPRSTRYNLHITSQTSLPVQIHAASKPSQTGDRCFSLHAGTIATSLELSATVISVTVPPPPRPAPEGRKTQLTWWSSSTTGSRLIRADGQSLGMCGAGNFGWMTRSLDTCGAGTLRRTTQSLDTCGAGTLRRTTQSLDTCGAGTLRRTTQSLDTCGAGRLGWTTQSLDTCGVSDGRSGDWPGMELRTAGGWHRNWPAWS
ncbi:uncharacterized protein LOC122886438 [Siniperca chuatsi]|uniref:uncharacterized protein LOC122886438 n=1 Tax=Siniperca chuatsi TaxID=119488 RepID=UPI001CE1041E|nr:uncharacterized protein LOC122886438 [Siniperca chuatsi]